MNWKQKKEEDPDRNSENLTEKTHSKTTKSYKNHKPQNKKKKTTTTATTKQNNFQSNDTMNKKFKRPPQKKDLFLLYLIALI